MARRESKRAKIERLKELLLTERDDVEDGILSAAKKVFTDDLKQRKIGEARKIVESL